MQKELLEWSDHREINYSDIKKPSTSRWQLAHNIHKKPKPHHQTKQTSSFHLNTHHHHPRSKHEHSESPRFTFFFFILLLLTTFPNLVPSFVLFLLCHVLFCFFTYNVIYLWLFSREKKHNQRRWIQFFTKRINAETQKSSIGHSNKEIPRCNHSFNNHYLFLLCSCARINFSNWS